MSDTKNLSAKKAAPAPRQNKKPISGVVVYVIAALIIVAALVMTIASRITRTIATLSVGYRGETFSVYHDFGNTLRSLSEHYQLYYYPTDIEVKHIDDIEAYLTDKHYVNNTNLSPYIYFNDKGSEDYDGKMYINSDSPFGGIDKNEQLKFTSLSLMANEEYTIDGKKVVPHVTTKQEIFDLFGTPSSVDEKSANIHHYSYNINSFEVYFYIYVGPYTNGFEDNEGTPFDTLSFVKIY